MRKKIESSYKFMLNSPNTENTKSKRLSVSLRNGDKTFFMKKKPKRCVALIIRTICVFLLVSKSTSNRFLCILMHRQWPIGCSEGYVV